MVQDILRLAIHCSQIHYTHIWREANFMADAIAKVGYSVDVLVWDHSLPLNTAFAFHLDELGCGCDRGFVV